MSDTGITDAEPEFDLSLWVQGIVPAVDTVRVYARPDLADDLGTLRSRLAKAKPDADRGMDDEGPAILAALIEQTEAELEASGVDFKVQGRSSTRLQKIADDAKAEGVTDVTEVILRQVHDQIVEPAGLTLAELLHMNEVIEPQVVRLVHAAREVNTKAPRVDVPFSRGPSGARNKPTS